MKIYVAAKWEIRELVLLLYDKLRSAGHAITHDWTGEEKKTLHEHADDDLRGVLSCDALVILPHERGKGLYTELGAALATRKRVFVLCKGESRDWNIFLQHKSCKYVVSVEELLTQLSDA